MANINKIKLSGTTYNIQDLSASKSVELTQAQYDALAVKDPNTFYIITDAQGADLSQYYTSAQTESAITQAVSGKVDTSTFNTYSGSVDTALSGKQDTLVSGTNIKTINNESILGSGNIDIQGGSGINVVQTTGTSTADVMSQDAVTTQLNNKANKTDAFGGYFYGLSNNQPFIRYKNINNGNIGNEIYYPTINGKETLTSNDTWAKNNLNFSLVETSAITTSVTSASTDAQVPSAKSVYDQLGGLKLVKLTQSEYDALSTKDSNTLYVIVN